MYASMHNVMQRPAFDLASGPRTQRKVAIRRPSMRTSPASFPVGSTIVAFTKQCKQRCSIAALNNSVDAGT